MLLIFWETINKYAHRNTVLGNGEYSLQFWECKSKMKFKYINDLFYSSTTNLCCFSSPFSMMGLSLKCVNLNPILESLSQIGVQLDVCWCALQQLTNSLHPFKKTFFIFKRNQEMLASCYCVLTFVFDNPSILWHCCCWLIIEKLIVFN